MHLIHFERGRGRGEKEEEGKGGRDTYREVLQLLIRSTNDPKNQDRARQRPGARYLILVFYTSADG